MTSLIPDAPAPGAQPEALWLDEAINGLRRAEPEMSASVVLTARQRRGLILAIGVIVPLVVWQYRIAAVAVLTLLNFGYAAAVFYRVMLGSLTRGPNHPERPGGMIRVSDEAALAVADDDLPVYTILLPAYGEPGIVPQLLRGVGAIDYPRHRLDIQLLLEADDTTTLDAAYGSDLSTLARIVEVPAAEPRTKPKACNYGLQQATGEFVTIYDAEDIPDPLQLRRAVVAFGRVDADVACVQARLGYRNAQQNLLTRWFAVEYDAWFGFLLPGLARIKAPIPLGGTSNHLRTDVLRAAHGWDPFNVTEDADLGIRLARMGYRSEVLDSVTWEEANSDVINWARQRSRWNKGYLQTALIHLRHPRLLTRELGFAGLANFLLVVLATPVLSLLNPVAWLLSLCWWMGNPSFISDVFPAWLIYLSVFNLFVGNFATVYLDVLALRDLRRPGLLLACLTIPVYWVLMAVGTAKAFAQLITAPSYWEKTAHGLDQPSD